jgi:hypothetical protein
VTDVETPGDFLVNGELSVAVFMHNGNEHFASVTAMNCRGFLVLAEFVQLLLQLL